ncbi:MAG: outer membrane protein assembly factor BamE [Magnetospirillum sp. WYHS-4]
MRTCHTSITLRALALAAVVLSIGCSPRIDSRGNLPDPERLAEIKAGQITKDEVLENLGSPSSIGAFDEETWYYVSERTETNVFFAPEVKDRKVLVLKFDKKGTLADIRQLGYEDGYAVRPIQRETPTGGNEVGMFEQLFGNIGRFNKDSRKGGGGGGGE